MLIDYPVNEKGIEELIVNPFSNGIFFESSLMMNETILLVK
jgi:hypothetical protein